MCVVDDVQWMDRASVQVLAFVARRLLAQPVLVIFAARERDADLRGLPELVVEGLRPDDARDLLGSVIRWPLDRQVADRIVAETRGNPLALLSQEYAPARLAGGFGLPEAPPLAGSIRENLRQVQSLTEQTRCCSRSWRPNPPAIWRSWAGPPSTWDWMARRPGRRSHRVPLPVEAAIRCVFRDPKMRSGGLPGDVTR